MDASSSSQLLCCRRNMQHGATVSTCMLGLPSLEPGLPGLEPNATRRSGRSAGHIIAHVLTPPSFVAGVPWHESQKTTTCVLIVQHPPTPVVKAFSCLTKRFTRPKAAAEKTRSQRGTKNCQSFARVVPQSPFTRRQNKG